ncbi:succinate dehydrogenase, cytochrome b556 subunit [Falsirhodobacter algicola]|uniref:Succinate dehydrogenase cytochrome b556 subunit n=1 Tax=Falsirhodobacter algicola TaxID=2692330 RepID=A0A8J8MRB1_9RHOB|nr:succinate dehydrogenase, cytochrome b556 subunit [Falsirhodobacter algicola]QUS34853.1 succinate dehydrogenase, cytochrome b556 subunit [Falsirhodobacter algicola]
MADVKRVQRPLSPHLQVYRPQITSITSILTRITGNAMVVAVALIVWWLVAAASGEDAYATANGFITSWFGDLVMSLSVLGMWYHFLAGIRHMIWDSGHCLEVNTAEKLGIACLVGSVVLTLITLIAL